MEEQTQAAQARSKNTFEIFVALGSIVPWTLVASIGSGMLTPLSTYLSLNFFAQRHTDIPHHEIQCHIDMSPMYCQLALVDGNRLLTALAFIMPCCQFLTLPLVGVMSDAYGRKRTLLIVYCLVNSSLVFTDLFVFCDVTYWIAIAMNPFLNSQLVTTILNSTCVDLLESQDRSAGIALISSLDTVAYVIGLLTGMHLTLEHTFIIASCLVPVCIAWCILVFPETLPPEKRQITADFRNFLPWTPLPILWRTSTLLRLSVATAIAAFVDESSSRMMSTYYQRVMNWTAKDNYLFETMWDISMIVWLTFIFGLLVAYVGEIGTMAFGRIIGSIYVFIAVFIRKPSQAMINCLICAGPMTFALPAVAGLKSRLVGESEQGRMQAAISTVYIVSGSIGSVIGGFVFELFGNVDDSGSFDKIYVVAILLVLLNFVGLIVSSIIFYDLFRRTHHLMDERAQALFPSMKRLTSPDAPMLESSPETAPAYGSTC
ncbi:MFSD14A [Symbiodinium natans]|uniref:MFSD14A protein n=1 Tax=Symbiodinium natans TaxID=878477 RepID=A0A812L378_9DINO|nr:MFSD14A [Symbiodinium natans]